MISPKLLAMLKRHEGFRSEPYRCSQGYLTVGYGRNLDTVGINEHEAEYLLRQDIYRSIVYLDKYPWFAALDDVRQDALIDFMYNVGPATFAQFKKMISALEKHDYNKAAVELMDSRYAKQVGVRASIIAGLLRTGDPSLY